MRVRGSPARDHAVKPTTARSTTTIMETVSVPDSQRGT